MHSNTENGQLTAWSDDVDKLKEWYKSQFAEEHYYTINDNYFPAKGDFPANEIIEQIFKKVFKKDGPLEWYNPVNLEQPDHYGHGIQQEWVDSEFLINIERRYFRVV